MPESSPDRDVAAVGYEPPSGYKLDVEIYPGAELRRRALISPYVGRFERIDFHVFLCVTRGRYQQIVDFERIDCTPGSIIVLRPGQVHRFGDISRFHGWLLIFRAEVLPPSSSPETSMSMQLQSLPSHIALDGATRALVRASLEQMADDAKRPPSPSTNALLNSQLHTIITRVCIAGLGSQHVERANRALLERFVEYRAAVEVEHPRWQQVQDYARHLGCSARSLTRASQMFANVTAKRFLVERIVLEGKRLLVHTAAPVAGIANQLGFDEPTNFVKFFRREVGVTPGAFRREHSSG